MSGAEPANDDVILHVEGVTKVYPGTVALKEVNFAVRRGKVNVLVGENGAGKSTLMKILAGAELPTTGRILLDDEEIAVRSPRDAMSHGIGIIHQELSLFPNLSIAENIFAGREPRRGSRFVNKGAQRRAARDVMARLG